MASFQQRAEQAVFLRSDSWLRRQAQRSWCMRCLKFIHRRDPLRWRQLGFGVPGFAVLAVFASLFWINRTDIEAQLEPLPTSGTPVSVEQEFTEIAPAGNRIAWGFSDRWFPLIQAVPPSVAENRTTIN